jgi:DNA modification methylase
LRSYVDNDSPLKAHEIGLEETPEMFLDKMTAVFAEVRRVLRVDGVAWVNMGDSYWAQRSENGEAMGIGGTSFSGRENQTRAGGKSHTTYKPKDLMMMPARLALALQADGWWLRSQVVWSKPNPMPESVTDRPTKSHEFIYLLAKSERYWYDADAVREGTQVYTRRAGGYHDDVGTRPKDGVYRNKGGIADKDTTTVGRNLRDVWTIPTAPSAVQHFATYPISLAETCIKAGCPETVCSVCGAGYVPIVEKSGGTIGKGWTDHKGDLSQGMSQYMGKTGSIKNEKDKNGNLYTRNLKGYVPSCTCNAGTTPGMVLDPFGGAGTTALAAIKHNRHYQLIELNPLYVGIAQERIRNFDPFQTKVFADGSKQLSLFEVSA